ncbi:MBL fold metallo-hydrolase [Micromonospora sonneratiae]|uniref:MBL fold metallo-hydrolase n=1 Tax=Micromonospora sonneratiae TaxID=1184706 RepID=A0ABW3YB58_9ACTN
MTGHLTAPAAALADQLPSWATLVRAPNPGPMTLDGTNTWLLRAPGQEHAVVIDPGPADEEHLAEIARSGPVGLILITHGHFDHVEGARRCSELLGDIPVRAVDPAHCVDGVPLCPEADLNGFGLDIELLDTPGHTADSVCFLIGAAGQQAVFTGDTILGRGTTVVAWPDGDLGDYLASLSTLTAYEGIPALPGHGPALADCAAAARFYLAHRQARLDQVRQAVAQGAATAAEVVARVYADVDRALWPAAEWSVQAQLAYLGQQSGAPQSAHRNRESDPGSGGLETP